MNAHDRLERQLRDSVARAANRQRELRSRRGPWSRGLSALIVVATTAAALAVTAVALLVLHASRSPSPNGTTAPIATAPSRIGPRPPDPGPIPRSVDDAAVAAAWNGAWAKDPTCRPGAGRGPGAGVSHASPSAAMLSTLPILRRPATSADRLPSSLYIQFHGRRQLLIGGQGGDVYVRYVRRVRVAAGRTFYLVPVTRVGRPPLSPAAANRCYRLTVAALQAGLPKVPLVKRAPTRRYGDAEFALGRYNLETSTVQEGVALFAENNDGGGGGGGGVQSLGSIQQGGQLGGGGGGTPPTPIVINGIVPTDVATVTLTFPATRSEGRQLPALRATGDVINNVFVIPVPTLFQRGGWPTTAIWRSASGRVIKTVNERPYHP